MDNALIISCSKNGTSALSEMLNAAGYHQVATVGSCGEARRKLLERDFELIIVDAPLLDESGESFSRHVASKGIAQVMLLVKSEYFDAMSTICEDDGVLTVAKPIEKTVFWSAVKLAKAAQNRLKRVQVENAKLKQRIEDIRIVDRAKCLLISYMNLSEKEAHRFIEKQSMDMRATKREVAEVILKTYET